MRLPPARGDSLVRRTPWCGAPPRRSGSAGSLERAGPLLVHSSSHTGHARPSPMRPAMAELIWEQKKKIREKKIGRRRTSGPHVSSSIKMSLRALIWGLMLEYCLENRGLKSWGAPKQKVGPCVWGCCWSCSKPTMNFIRFLASWFPSLLHKLQNSPKFPSCALLQIQSAKSSEVYHCYTGHKVLCLFCKGVKVYFTTYNLCDNLIFHNELWTWVSNTLRLLKLNKFAHLVGSKCGFLYS